MESVKRRIKALIQLEEALADYKLREKREWHKGIACGLKDALRIIEDEGF